MKTLKKGSKGCLETMHHKKNPARPTLLTFKKICFICFNESPLKMMKNAFYFILKVLFVLKIFKFLP